MVREITVYPTPPSVEYGTDVRVLTDEISLVIEDLKDTIEANSLDALAAFQIGSMYNIIVLKNDDTSSLVEGETYLELINPRIISASGKITTVEKTAYFPGLSAKVQRHENISVIYEDRDLKQQVIKASGDEAVRLQRKIDYTFGSSFINKLSQDEKKLFEQKLEFGSDVAISESCPTTFKRDYLVKLSNIVTVLMVVLLIFSIFVSDENLLNDMWTYQLYMSFAVLATNIVYFFYAQYEGKQFTSCTSCQIGNIIGTVAISLSKLSIVMLLSYFVM